ncbi:hypothetical protein QBC33DRAFT_438116, partial [Phialemonium atrogriseum]
WLKYDLDNNDTQVLKTLDSLFGRKGIFHTPGQKVQNFLDNFKTLEAELPKAIPERYQVRLLLIKLDPAIIQQIVSNSMPRTRQELVSAAKRAKMLIQETLRQQDRSSKPPAMFQNQGQDRHNTPAMSQRPNNQLGHLTCYRCKKKGHVATNCTK